MLNLFKKCKFICKNVIAFIDLFTDIITSIISSTQIVCNVMYVQYVIQ